MNFGEAIALLKDGKKVTRSGWNGAGQYVYYVPPARYKTQTPVARAEFGDDVPYRAYLALRTVQADVCVWTASTSDILADDWVLVD